MTHRHPPRVATWLLQRLGAGRHSESLEGDLIEQYAQGRSRLWYWRQAAMAIVVARARAFRAQPWIAATKIFFRFLTELAVVLGVVSVVAQSRRTHELRDMLSPAFVGTMALLISIALVGPLLSLTILKSKRPHAPVKHLIVLLAVAALGAGTLTWASTTRRQCGPDACTCQKPEQRPIAEAGQ